MAIPRETLTALDGFDQSTDWSFAMDRANKRLMQWLTSGSFMVVHLTIFGTMLLATFLWAMITHPTDLSTLRPFVYWGILAAVHAALSGAYAVAARLMGWDAPAYYADVVPANRSVESQPHQAVPATIWAAGAERAPLATRGWAAPTSGRVSIPEDQPSGAWPRQPAILQASERQDVGEVTWPEAVPLSTVLNTTSTSPSRPADEVVSIDHEAHSGADKDQARSWLEGFVESRTRDKEQRWSWIEAAAASWIALREQPRDEQASAPAEDVVIASEASSPDDDAPVL